MHRIDQIPVQNLDNIKQWLATLDIKYYEGKSNLNWKPLLRQIKVGPGRYSPPYDPYVPPICPLYSPDIPTLRPLIAVDVA